MGLLLTVSHFILLFTIIQSVTNAQYYIKTSSVSEVENGSPRNKRTLGIVLQGFADSLGYDIQKRPSVLPPIAPPPPPNAAPPPPPPPPPMIPKPGPPRLPPPPPPRAPAPPPPPPPGPAPKAGPPPPPPPPPGPTPAPNLVQSIQKNFALNFNWNKSLGPVPAAPPPPAPPAPPGPPPPPPPKAPGPPPPPPPPPPKPQGPPSAPAPAPAPAPKKPPQQSPYYNDEDDEQEQHYERQYHDYNHEPYADRHYNDEDEEKQQYYHPYQADERENYHNAAIYNHGPASWNNYNSDNHASYSNKQLYLQPQQQPSYFLHNYPAESKPVSQIKSYIDVVNNFWQHSPWLQQRNAAKQAGTDNEYKQLEPAAVNPQIAHNKAYEYQPYQQNTNYNANYEQAPNEQPNLEALNSKTNEESNPKMSYFITHVSDANKNPNQAHPVSYTYQTMPTHQSYQEVPSQHSPPDFGSYLPKPDYIYPSQCLTCGKTLENVIATTHSPRDIEVFDEKNAAPKKTDKPVKNLKTEKTPDGKLYTIDSGLLENYNDYQEMPTHLYNTEQSQKHYYQQRGPFDADYVGSSLSNKKVLPQHPIRFALAHQQSPQHKQEDYSLDAIFGPPKRAR